jgi:hypothetical protein
MYRIHPLQADEAEYEREAGVERVEY